MSLLNLFLITHHYNLSWISLRAHPEASLKTKLKQMTNRGNEREQDKNNKGSDNAKGRGFASMDENRQREIASMGGKAAHQKGTAHEFTPDEARKAGREGGKRSSSSRSQSNNR